MKPQYSKLLLLIFIGFSFLKPIETNAQCVTGAENNANYPKRDLRGVFIPTLFNISWPSTVSASGMVQQKAELITILDGMKANGYNSFVLQVRPAGDAFYNSAIEPWSHWLTGTEGTVPNPYWDPLEFAIAEAHARGMDLHAWLNPYRVKYGTYTTASDHVISENPEWTFIDASNSTRTLLDPGLPVVRDYIVSIVEDLSTRYDLDGIHFDDYFYPSGGMTSPPNNQDKDSYAAHNPGGLSLSNWRRKNVNDMIGMVYDAIQTINTNANKNVVFGVSPFGIWKNGVPAGTTGTSSYDALFCDPIAWMQAGKVDYLAPQVYWDTNSSGQDYNLLTQWWNDQADTYNTQVYVSQAYYKMLSPQFWAASELQAQINFNRSAPMDATFGQMAYRYNEIGNNTSGINTALNATQFRYKSYAPPILGTGKDVVCPVKPDNIRFGPLKIMWDTPVAATDGDLPKKYVVYAFSNAAQATTNKNDGSKIIDIVSGNELTLTQSQIDTKFLVVTSLDKNNNESGDFCNKPLQDITAACSVPSITAPTAKFNCSGSYTATTSTVFPIVSSTVVTWTYNFGGGNTFIQKQNVIIQDATPPTVITQDITVTLTGATTTITASDINNGSSDNCSIKTMSIDVDTFSCADIGVQPVLLTVEDNNGNLASAPAMVTVQGDLTEYTISGWSNGVPHLGSLTKINGNYSTSQGNFETCTCEVTATGTLTVEADDYVKVERDIVVDGTLTVAHTGNLVQTDDAATVTNNGTINVNLITPALNARDFMIMGSPMTVETNTMFSAYQVLNHTTENFTPYVGVPPVVGVNFHDQESNDWSNFAGTFNAGEGYLVRPSMSSGGTYNYTYDQGTLNNGVVTYNAFFGTDKEDSPNVLSNPYASAIDADLLISSNAIIDELYFWEHLTTPGSGIPGPLSANFSMEDISTRNFTMGIPASNDPGTSTTPNGVIATGQGFGIKANAVGPITFNNALRLTSGNTTLRQTVDKDLIWINVREPQYHMGSTAGIGFTENATPALDQGYDTMKLGTVVSLYSHLEDGSEQLGIQGRESFDTNITIPMGFSTQIEVDGGLPYTISIANLEGNNIENVTVYLVDHLLNITTNLSQGNYEFVSNAGTFDNRFTLQFEEGVILGTSENDLEGISIYPNPTKNILRISSPKVAISRITIYDVSGRQVDEVRFSSEGNYQIDLSQLDTALYFVKITSESGTISKRVIKE